MFVIPKANQAMSFVMVHTNTAQERGVDYQDYDCIAGVSMLPSRAVLMEANES